MELTNDRYWCCGYHETDDDDEDDYGDHDVDHDHVHRDHGGDDDEGEKVADVVHLLASHNSFHPFHSNPLDAFQNTCKCPEQLWDSNHPTKHIIPKSHPIDNESTDPIDAL